jgi:hypothetical protein
MIVQTDELFQAALDAVNALRRDNLLHYLGFVSVSRPVVLNKNHVDSFGRYGAYFGVQYFLIINLIFTFKTVQLVTNELRYVACILHCGGTTGHHCAGTIP